MNNQCPACRSYLRKDATSCKCGWSESKQTHHAAPPLIEDEVGAFLNVNRKLFMWPERMPRETPLAARWWLDMQEPPKGSEAPRRVGTANGAERWECPYHLRIIATLRKFVTLSPNDQGLIIAAREDNTFWRGDDIDFFIRVIHETEEMRSIGVVAYRRRCLTMMQSFLGASRVNA